MRTREFKESYLVPNGIGAMLDIPLRRDDEMYGVLCSEHVGGRREWMIDEQNFAMAAANLIVMALTDDELRRHEESRGDDVAPATRPRPTRPPDAARA